MDQALEALQSNESFTSTRQVHALQALQPFCDLKTSDQPFFRLVKNLYRQQNCFVRLYFRLAQLFVCAKDKEAISGCDYLHAKLRVTGTI